MYVWDEDGDKRRKIKCVPILLSRVERERRRAKKTLVGARARMERLRDGAWQGQQHRCRKRVEKNNIFLDRKKKGDATLSDEARKKTTQLELYSFANCLSVSRYRVLPARAG